MRPEAVASILAGVQQRDIDPGAIIRGHCDPMIIDDQARVALEVMHQRAPTRQ